MKKLVYFVLLVMTFAACEEKKHGAFVVTGVVENAEGKKLSLVEAPYSNNQPVILDSTILKAKGSFTLRGRANEEGIYYLSLDGAPPVVLINDNNSIKVHYNVSDYRNYKIEGSPASISLQQLFEDYRRQDSIIFTTFRQIEELKTGGQQDSLVEVMRAKNDLQIGSLNHLVKDFIKNSKSPAAIFYALGLARETVPYEELKVLIDESAATYPEHSGLAKIKSIYATKKAAPSQKTGEAGTGYPLLDKSAPDLTMPDVNGKPVSISSFKGKYVLVDFWASWCGPCRQENPNVVAAYNQYKDKNFTILGISLDKDKEAWKNAIAKDNLQWTHISDLKYWQSAAVPAYGFEGIPFNVLIDPAGTIIASGLRGEQLSQKLSEVLK